MMNMNDQGTEEKNLGDEFSNPETPALNIKNIEILE